MARKSHGASVCLSCLQGSASTSATTSTFDINTYRVQPAANGGVDSHELTVIRALHKSQLHTHHILVQLCFSSRASAALL